MADTKPDIRLKRTGGAGLNTQWAWEVRVEGKVVKSGTAVGDEPKAFATARRAAERLARPGS